MSGRKKLCNFVTVNKEIISDAMKRLLFALGLLTLLTLTSCRGDIATLGEHAGDSIITRAGLLKMERAPGYTLVTVLNPWGGSRVLHRYVLVPRDSTVPDRLPEGTLVRTPIDRALVYSDVHTSILRDLGGFDAVKGVCDTRFFTDPEIRRRVDDGTIADCGESMSPSIERVIELHPDAILLSPYQDATYGQIANMNIPIIECADYMEFTPLGRAEWVKFYGALLGKEREADSIFNAVVHDYNAICDSAKTLKQRPLVLTEMEISGIWNVPGGHSYMARLILDAGGDYPWADNESTGSLSLDFNQVLVKAQQADIWLIKSFNIHSLQDILAANRLNANFKAYKQHRVYVCDTNKTQLFARFPFHPERLLKEYYTIFHTPEGHDVPTEFFKRVDQ